MRISPMQKYAMRLLMANGKIAIPQSQAWQQITGEVAERSLSSFGGIHSILQDMPLPKRQPKQSVFLNSNSPIVTRTKSDMEL